jgi:phosphoglycolate phosphatase-like HAD superfamily hydrolase
MDKRNIIPPHLIEDMELARSTESMSDAMIEIYLEQARQEQHEDEEYREWERIWHERYWEEYHNACSDL